MILLFTYKYARKTKYSVLEDFQRPKPRGLISTNEMKDGHESATQVPPLNPFGNSLLCVLESRRNSGCFTLHSSLFQGLGVIIGDEDMLQAWINVMEGRVRSNLGRSQSRVFPL